MKTLILIFIIWSIISAISANKKNRTPVPPPEQESTDYRLPQDLRRKWGPKSEKSNEMKAPDEVSQPPVIVEQCTMPKKVEGAKGQHRAATTLPERVTKNPSSDNEIIVEDENCGLGAFRQGDLTPGMLKNGIILSEILGPPVARRRKGYYQ